MMQNYIEQLLEDLQKATECQASMESMKKNLIDPEHLLEFDNQKLFDPLFNLSAIVGIDASMLPSENLLNDEQIELLTSKMEFMLQTLKIYPDFPHHHNTEITPRLRYKAMKENWESAHATIGTTEIHLNFCTSNDEENCPFPGYCSKCKNSGTFEDMDSNSDSDDGGFIPSIFNYCDRWCERCDFTVKCRNFAMQKEFFEELENNNNPKDEKPKDEKIEDFEDYLGRTFGPNFGNSETDFPFNSDDDDDDYDDDDNHGFFSPEKKSERHPLSLQTMSYSDSADLWLDSIKSTCKNNFKRWLALGTADQIFDAIDTVNWYHTFIYPKIRRALSGYFESEEDEYAAYDMNGSAKVTLLGIDNSIAAFNFLKRHLKSHLTEMAGLSEQLTSLRNDIEILFPEARSFIRPGFDE